MTTKKENTPIAQEKFSQPSSHAFELEEIQHEINSQRNLPLRTEGYVPPRNPLEKELAQIWSDILHLDQVGVQDDFFRLGGHSILATQVLAQVNQVFEIDMPVAVLFSQEEFTIEQLAQLVDRYQLEQANEDELSALLQEIDNLSEEKIQELLTQINSHQG